MPDLNKVFLMGRLTFDPELRRTASQTAVSQLRLATTRSWQGRDGERREETLYIDVTVWDRQAENCCQYLRKGSAIHVEGSLKMDTWDDKTTGEKRSKILVHADRVQFLDSRRADSGGDPDEAYGGGREPAAPRTRSTSQASRPSPAADARPSNGPTRPGPSPASEPPRSAMDLDDMGEDDIPF